MLSVGLPRVNDVTHDRGDNFAVATVLRGGGLSPQSARSANFGVLLRPLDNAAVSLDYWALDCRDDGREDGTFVGAVFP